METRERIFEFDMETRSDEKHGNHIVGKPIVFNSVYDRGLFDEVIDSCALIETDLRDVRFLVNHDTSKLPLARSRNNNENSTMQMMVDSEGMSIRVNLDTENNTDARNLYSAVGRGDVSGMSFMFTIDADEWDDLDTDHPTRHITKIGKVYEVSAVTFPAYEATEIFARDRESLDEARSALENARQSALDSEKAKALEIRKNELIEKLKKMER